MTIDQYIGIAKDIAFYTFLLWFFFIAAATVKTQYERATLSPFWRTLAKPFVYLFFICDIAYNVTYGSLLYLEMPHPKRLTLSQRIQRIIGNPKSKLDQYWRKPIALFMAKYMINPFQPGHISL